MEKSISRIDNRKVKLSTLWIVVLFNMIFADIVGFMNPGVLAGIMSGNTGIKVTEELLLVFSILLEIPILMVFMSRILSDNINRWANIIASLITIVFVTGAGSTYLSYFFFGSIEVLCMLLIIWYAWKWPKPEKA